MKAQYLLIQDVVLDASEYPHHLMYNLLDNAANFQVAVGCINEFGKPEIVDFVARAFSSSGCAIYRVSSPIDGFNRMIGVTGTMAQFIQNRLNVCWHQDLYSDLCNLPVPIVIRGEL